MTVIEKIRKACELSKAGNYEEALASLSDAQDADPWNGHLIDLTWRVATLYDLSQQNNLSEKEREEFIKWLPGILERIENSTLARPIFQSVGGKPANKTAPSVSPKEPPPPDTSTSPASPPIIPEHVLNKIPVTKREADAEPGGLSQVDYELFLLKRLEQQRQLTSPLPPTQAPGSAPPGPPASRGTPEVPLGAGAGTPVEAPSLSEEEWKSETENVPGKLEYGFRPANSPGGKFGIGSRTFLVMGAIVVPLLVASGVYYFLLRSDTGTIVRQPTQGIIKRVPEQRKSEEQPAELKVQPQTRESVSATEAGVKEKKPTPVAPQTAARRDRSAETRVSTRRSDVQPSTATPRSTVKPVTPSETPSPAAGTPVAGQTLPAAVDSAKVRPAPTVEPPPRTGPNKVTLRVFINSVGRPTRAEIISSTDPSYNDLSIEEVMKSTFPPGEERTVVLGFVYP